MLFELKRYEFVLEAETPLAHHQESFGNQAIAMRRKVRLPDGSFATIPVITGDALRHQLREAAAYAFLDAAGLLDAEKLTESALRFLFAGGMVTGRGDANAVKLDQYREMTELVPAAALLGGCASNRVIPGRLTVDDGVLVCRETAHQLPAWATDGLTLDTYRAHVELVQRVRMDPTLDPQKRTLLSEHEQAGVVRRLDASEAAHAEDNALVREQSKSSMMPRSFEVVVAGSLFFWRVEATCLSDLDVDTFHTMIAAFLGTGRVGGKRGTGHGKVRAVKAQGVVLNRPSERLHPVDTTALAPKVGELFRAHVAARKKKIAKFLGEIDA